MKPEAILVAWITIWLGGCALRGNPQTAKAAPPAPKPVVAPAPPAPPPALLSVPQTQVELPPPQPVSDEARLTTEPPVDSAAPPAPAAPKPPPRNRQTAGPPRETTVQGPPASAANEPAKRPEVQELVSPEEQKQLQADTQRDRQEALRIFNLTSGRRLTRQKQQLRSNVQSLLKLSNDAEGRGDLRQARDLAGRAAVLAKELQQ